MLLEISCNFDRKKYGVGVLISGLINEKETIYEGENCYYFAGIGSMHF
jgi:hypothetical protein